MGDWNCGGARLRFMRRRLLRLQHGPVSIGNRATDACGADACGYGAFGSTLGLHIDSGNACEPALFACEPTLFGTTLLQDC